MAATEEYGRTHSITEGREREIEAEYAYAASRQPIREEFTHPDPQRRYGEREKSLIMSRYPPHIGVVNAFDDPEFIHSDDPVARLYREILDAQPLGSNDDIDRVGPFIATHTVPGEI